MTTQELFETCLLEGVCPLGWSLHKRCVTEHQAAMLWPVRAAHFGPTITARPSASEYATMLGLGMGDEEAARMIANAWDNGRRLDACERMLSFEEELEGRERERGSNQLVQD